MKLDKRIEQAMSYNVKQILINNKSYKALEKETKQLLHQSNVNIIFDENQKEFMCKFE